MAINIQPTLIPVSVVDANGLWKDHNYLLLYNQQEVLETEMDVDGSYILYCVDENYISIDGKENLTIVAL